MKASPLRQSVSNPRKTSLLAHELESKYEDYEKFIESLQITPINRNSEHINYISHYLFKTDLMDKINKEKLSQTATLNLMQSCAKYATYKELSKGEILFQIADPADKFYIILRGAVN